MDARQKVEAMLEVGDCWPLRRTATYELQSFQGRAASSTDRVHVVHTGVLLLTETLAFRSALSYWGVGLLEFKQSCKIKLLGRWQLR